jgi:hypothetical protein
MARSYASDGTVFVDVSYNDTLRNGTRIVQGTDRKFTYPASHAPGLGSNQSDWSPVADQTSIGWMVFNLDLRNTSGNQATVTVANGTDTLTYRFNRSSRGSGGKLQVEVENSVTGGTDTTSCVSVGGRVLLDGRAGEAFLGECSFTGINAIEGPYTVTIRDGHNLAGQYDFIVDERWNPSTTRTIDASVGGTDRQYTHCPAGGEAPCLAPVVWKGQIDLIYRSSDVDYATTSNITVYDP